MGAGCHIRKLKTALRVSLRGKASIEQHCHACSATFSSITFGIFVFVQIHRARQASGGTAGHTAQWRAGTACTGVIAQGNEQPAVVDGRHDCCNWRKWALGESQCIAGALHRIGAGLQRPLGRKPPVQPKVEVVLGLIRGPSALQAVGGSDVLAKCPVGVNCHTATLGLHILFLLSVKRHRGGQPKRLYEGPVMVELEAGQAVTGVRAAPFNLRTAAAPVIGKLRVEQQRLGLVAVAAQVERPAKTCAAAVLIAQTVACKETIGRGA